MKLPMNPLERENIIGKIKKSLLEVYVRRVRKNFESGKNRLHSYCTIATMANNKKYGRIEAEDVRNMFEDYVNDGLIEVVESEDPYGRVTYTFIRVSSEEKLGELERLANEK
jgi:ribosomal protein S17E